MTDFTSYLLSKNKKISGYLINGEWTDIGQLKDYWSVNSNELIKAHANTQSEKLMQHLERP
jgi:NDP-sugar pyrophosphorylase family protein